jgi:hypothetical protein
MPCNFFSYFRRAKERRGVLLNPWNVEINDLGANVSQKGSLCNWLLNLWKCKFHRMDIFTRWYHRYICHNLDARCTLEFLFQQPPLNTPSHALNVWEWFKGNKVCNLQSLGVVWSSMQYLDFLPSCESCKLWDSFVHVDLENILTCFVFFEIDCGNVFVHQLWGKTC